MLAQQLDVLSNQILIDYWFDRRVPNKNSDKTGNDRDFSHYVSKLLQLLSPEKQKSLNITKSQFNCYKKVKSNYGFK